MNPAKIAQTLRELRGKKTIEEVAKDIGISTSALTMYELGQRIPRDEIKEKLAAYYNTPIGDIFYSKNVTNSDTM